MQMMNTRHETELKVVGPFSQRSLFDNKRIRMIGDRSEQLMHEVCAGREPLSALEDLAMQYYDIKESLDKRFKNIHNEKRVPENFEAVKTQIAWQNKITHALDTCRSMLTIAEKQESLP